MNLEKNIYLVLAITLIYRNNERVVMNGDIESVLGTFEKINLQDLGPTLLDRVEVKYLFAIKRMPEVLQDLSEEYYILVAGSTPVSHYENLYFDTPDYEMYVKHHNHRLTRHKVRFRNYKDTNNSYFEIKQKTNTGRVVKTRIETSGDEFCIQGTLESVLSEKTGYAAMNLKESLQINYSRLTLVSKKSQERITLDTELKFLYQDKEKELNNIVIAEVKQLHSQPSLFIDKMHRLQIRPVSVSKYCLGVASLVSTVKINNFKRKLLYVKKLTQKYA